MIINNYRDGLRWLQAHGYSYKLVYHYGRGYDRLDDPDAHDEYDIYNSVGAVVAHNCDLDRVLRFALERQAEWLNHLENEYDKLNDITY